MSIFDDKSLKSVAEAVMKVMQQEELKGNQHKIDANKNGKVDAHDFKLLRSKKSMKEEDEGIPKKKEEKFHMDLDKLVHKTLGKSPKEMKEGMGSDSKASQLHQSIRSKNPNLPKNPNYYKELGATYDIEDDTKRHAAQTELKKKHGMKEETEQLQEYESKSGVYRNKGTYGGSKGTEYGNTDWDKEEKDSKKVMDNPPKASRKLGARQNFKRSTRVNESFTQMVASYRENGLKSLVDMVSFEEEVDNETYEKEMKDQKMKFDGKKKGADVAKASVQAVKVEEETHTEIQVIDMTDADNIKKEIIDIAEAQDYKVNVIHKDSEGNTDSKIHQLRGVKIRNAAANMAMDRHKAEMKKKGIDVRHMSADIVKEESELEERTLTEPESKKKEEIVKSMKKNMQGFRDRYGDKGKSVAYATATKIAKEKA